MTEFDLVRWECELAAWRRRLAGRDAPSLREELEGLGADLAALRAGAADADEAVRARLDQRRARLVALAELLALYDDAVRAGSRASPPVLT